MTIGVRFRPSDQEIINDYLIKRMDGHDYSRVIRDIDLCRYEPWELPGISVLKDQDVWYFFCLPEYKYRNSERVNRTTGSGLWKPTGTVRPVRGRGGAQIGTKRTLVFYSKTGSGSVSVRTTWVIHEFQVLNVLPGQTKFFLCKLKDKSDEQTDSSAVEEAGQDFQVGFDAGCDTPSAAITLGGIARIQQTLYASDSEFDLNGLSTMEREAVSSFADSFLTEPEESVDCQPQRPQNQSYLVDVGDTETDVSHREYQQQLGSSSMNDRHANARQFRQAASVQKIYESLPSSSHDVNQSRLRDHRVKSYPTGHYQLQSFTDKSTNQAGEYKHDAKKVFQVRGKTSVRNTVPGHQPTPPLIYIVNVIVGLVLLIVVITQMMQFSVGQNHSEFSDDFELPDWFYG